MKAFDNNHYDETRYCFIKNTVEGIIISWEDNPFELSEEICLIKR